MKNNMFNYSFSFCWRKVWVKSLSILLLTGILFSCKSTTNEFDAQGTFEADEVIVSSELPGKITRFTVSEGDSIAAGTVVGQVDALGIALQKEQVEASIGALSQKTADAGPQVQLLQNQLQVQQTQLKNLEQEKKRVQKLLAQDAATGKQLDDINYQAETVRKQMLVTQQQVAVLQNNISTQNRSILSESKPLQKRAAQLADQMNRANIINPITGTVLTKYAEPGEMATAGKALYKIADLSTVNLRAYITGAQIPLIKIGQPVKVYIDNGKGGYIIYPGNISWVSDKAEFTPKTIQTKDERANLVYAIKVKVKNDGLLKIGMYGELKFG
ncbi:MAG: HlyD family efflux transporter periplasmic adaptor subunit [Ferruginibacter sp.]